MVISKDNCRISVIVCTYNRSAYLGKTIDSLLDQTIPDEHYEIIIVDNASTDSTASVVKGYSNKNIRYIYENNMGLSYSRNTGFRESKGKIVAYIDDDAVACRDWLERILEVFSQDDAIAAVGGKIVPVWEVDKPDWITPNLYTYFSCIDWSDKPFFLKKGSYLYGCNMSFRKRVLADCGGFSTRLGRIGNNLLSNEEWELFKCIDTKGLKKYYDPDIYVDHTVISSRIKWKWLKSRLYWQGISNLYYDYYVERFTKTQLLKKYSREMTSFFSREISKLMNGKGDKKLLRLYIIRYFGAGLHFFKICLGLIKR